MDDLLKHKEAFEVIVQKYGLDKEDKAGRIADFITSQQDRQVSAAVFSVEFGVPIEEAQIFLSFILRGLTFKEDVLDKR